MRQGTQARGFVLVVAVMVLVLAAAVAEMSMRLALSESLAASYEVAESRADYLAEAGLAQTASYLTELARLEPDFDRALDPSLNTTCSYSSSSALVTIGGTTTDDFLPPIPGGAPSTDPGNRFWKVPFNDGAYYVRIDDNSDDGHEGWACDGTSACTYTNKQNRNNFFPAATNNRETGGPYYPEHASATSCPEAASPEIDALKDNPVRDRDKVVLVTVIGIFPGTDWSMARARKAYRLLMGPTRGNPGILAGGSVTVGTNSDLCGASGGVHANVSAGLGTGSCMCGEASDSDGTIGGGPTQCTTPSDCAVATGCAPVPLPASVNVNIPTIDPWEARYMNAFQRDGANQCYFFFGQNGVGYFWDHTRTAVGGEDCNSFPAGPSMRTPRPCGAGPNDVADGVYEGITDPYCHCWVPVYYDNKAGALPTPPNPYRSLPTVGPQRATVPLDVAASNNDGCTQGYECTAGQKWTPKWRTASEFQATYDFETLCGGFTAAGRPLWDTNGAGGNPAINTGPIVDSDVPDALFFMDGPPGGVVDINTAFTATMSIISPMQVRIRNSSTLRPPAWARSYLVVSGSASNGLGSSSSCELSSTGTLQGLIACQGTVRVGDNAILNGNIASKGDVTIGNNVDINMDATLPNIAGLPVRPVVWADAAF